ncbi:MAG TPA: hypothetical protein VNP03_16450 [Pseudonocardia sp.]|nr:hypothetical protein [Pseudonocardia sp.]
MRPRSRRAEVAADPTTRAAPGLLRVVWLPGSDQLEGTCHCGAGYLADGPAEVWDWLLGHPVGHHPAPPRPTTRTSVLNTAGATR